MPVQPSHTWNFLKVLTSASVGALHTENLGVTFGGDKQISQFLQITAVTE
jgi:hypothetical protein